MKALSKEITEGEENVKRDFPWLNILYLHSDTYRVIELNHLFGGATVFRMFHTRYLEPKLQPTRSTPPTMLFCLVHAQYQTFFHARLC
jgi:hypothetical protein